MTHERRPKVGPDHSVQTQGKCPDCGKVRYRSRADAKKAARTRNLPGMSPYECSDGYWHLGHLPPVVKRGVVGRESLVPTQVKR